MNIILFSYNFSPDLGAGSFRATALASHLSKGLKAGGVLHVITTLPNRYGRIEIPAVSFEKKGNIWIYRVSLPKLGQGKFSQIIYFVKYAFSACIIAKSIDVDLSIGTTSKLMTGVMTSFFSRMRSVPYYLDVRDIFSDTFSSLYSQNRPLLSKALVGIFLGLEKYILRHAAGVNVVSDSFKDYFKNHGVDVSKWDLFPNGIDREFINFDKPPFNPDKKEITITYAGNIGNGQGLEDIIPDMAEKLGCMYRFVVIGGGVKRKSLEAAILSKGLSNVELISAVDRRKLIWYYRRSDILFLHLNDVPAFKRVLPSKIFEYAATGLPIVAGIAGYSASFLYENVSGAKVFSPKDVDGAVSCIKNILESNIEMIDRSAFVKAFSRDGIMNKMSLRLSEITVAKTN